MTMNAAKCITNLHLNVIHESGASKGNAATKLYCIRYQQFQLLSIVVKYIRSQYTPVE